MTRDQAIRILNCCYYINFFWPDGEPIPAEQQMDAFEMAIEALKAPVRIGRWVEVKGDFLT